MIGRLQGILIEKQPPQLIIDVGGIGYEVVVPMSTLYQLPDLGQPATLYIHQQIREDAHILYGFFSATELMVFKQLVKVNGVGPRMGLALLSTLSIDELAVAISTKDAKRLSAVPGIGQKTAERLILELQGKLLTSIALTHQTVSACNQNQRVLEDVMGALLALGYSEKESNRMVKDLPDGVDVNQGIRLALKKLATR